MFVEDLRSSQEFYSGVCGLVEILPEPSLGAVFMGNGSSHHDVALVEVPKQDLVGPDGHLLAKAGSIKPSINHLAFEMETERQLVEAYERALQAGVTIERTTDHGIAHSVYLRSPDGVMLELFADATADWRSKFQKPGDGAMSVAWQPLAATPCDEMRFHDDAPVWRQDDAPLHPRRMDHAGLTVSSMPDSLEFMTAVIGLDITEQRGGKVGLGARCGPSLVLDENMAPGVNHLAFELERPFDLTALEKNGVSVEDQRTEAHRHSLFLVDPDGMRVELFFDPRGV
jgi:catechol 2,3-dioxygenase